jgi:hypothetical protein
MSDKTKTKAELLEMLAEAVRNTQPQPVAQPDPARDPQPERKRKTQSGKTRPASQRTVKTKNVRASASRKQQRQ